MATSLARNSLYTLFANVSVALSNWLLLVIIAKQFSSEQLGQFVLAISICAPAFLFASFKVRTLLIVDSDWEYTLEEYALARILANAIVSILLVIAVLTTLFDISLICLALVLIYKWCDAWTEFCHSYMRRVYQFEYTALSLSLRSIVTILSVGLSAFISDSFDMLLFAWMSVTALFACIDSYFMWQVSIKKEARSFSWFILFRHTQLLRILSLYRQYLTIAFALVISSLFVNLPNILLGILLSVKAAGQFATISYFLVAGGILINSLSQATTPYLTQYFKASQLNRFIALLKKLCLLGLTIGLGGLVVSILFGKYFLTLFYNVEIAEYYQTLNWVMLAAAVRYIYIFLGTGLGAVKQFHVQTKIYTLGLVTLLVSSYFLIGRYGLEGAAMSMLLSTCIELTLFFSVIKKQLTLAFLSKKVMA